MTRTMTAATAATLLLAGLMRPAAAHVDYTDLSDPLTSPGGVNGASFATYAWFAGTLPTLGDSHDLAGGTFFKFHLAQDSLVSITFKDDEGQFRLDPAFSLYRGLLPDEAHDDATFDPLNPKGTLPPFTKQPSPVDNGVTADAFGRVSPFRDTAHVDYDGQFDALHSWSMANASGDWSVIDYVTHVGPANGNAVSLSGFLLQAGDYTIAAAGGRNCGGDPTCLAGIVPGTLSLSVAPVPEPSTTALMAGGFLLLAMLGRRRLRVAGRRIGSHEQ